MDLDYEIPLVAPISFGYIVGTLLQEHISLYSGKIYILLQILNFIIPDIIAGYFILKYINSVKLRASHSEKLLFASYYFFGVFWIAGESWWIISKILDGIHPFIQGEIII